LGQIREAQLRPEKVHALQVCCAQVRIPEVCPAQVWDDGRFVMPPTVPHIYPSLQYGKVLWVGHIDSIVDRDAPGFHAYLNANLIDIKSRGTRINDTKRECKRR
jgi:hypothetical protein